MDEAYCIPYRETGYFSGLICDYLDRKENLKPFYNRFPELNNFSEQIKEKQAFSAENRKLLVNQLKDQYAYISDKGATLDNIEQLSNKTTFTVTTGHQLNIFTGPLYFIYKIITAINLAEELNAKYAQNHFVPVYWMATEDHDFPEINHINTTKGKLSWDVSFGGPVGRMATSGIEDVINELEEILGTGKKAGKIISMLRESYLENQNLAKATRMLVHELFKNKGLVIIDGDDAALKKSMIPYFKRDLFEHLPETEVKKTSDELQELYFEQVHAREINLFYIKNGLRERIERSGDHWVVLNTDIRWNRDELEKELEQHPECFSPNVILRPLYQEVILPNLAYIGGGGELAYWFQLKSMFEAFGVPFPMLILRNSVQFITNNQLQKLQKLDLNLEQLFQPLHAVKKDYVIKNAPVDPDLKAYEQKLEAIFKDLEKVAQLTDKSMMGAVNAQRQKQLNGLANLKKRLIKAEKRQKEDIMQRIEMIYNQLFPSNGLQERHDNFLPYYAGYGEEILEKLYSHIKPLDFRFRIIEI